jgi:hypothetical protein
LAVDGPDTSYHHFPGSVAAAIKTFLFRLARAAFIESGLFLKRNRFKKGSQSV